MNPHFPPPDTGQPASEKSLHPKSFQSWRWVFLAAILLAAVTISTFYFSSAQAQGDDGAITGLTLTSDAPGTLTVSWDTASPTPTDYRVDWAKSTEQYKSWKVDEGHIYPTPDDTTATITDLSHDTEYKIRMRARYYKGEHFGKSWGGPWATATITVAGEPAETPTPEPSPDPTPEPGTIDTLAATDDDTGQLVLTWETPAAPNATPTDYHVNWAKSADEYPADTAEAGNAHPTTTTHTLASLEYDTDYNVRVRARYTDGENANSPWNGPWTETAAQVKLPLPMTPNMTGAAVSPESQVFLFWSDPSNDSITGYQILRGPDAANLVIIEEDTGSSSTSYTDTTPPAGETHTYAVKARNPSGLSELSNTTTATVPAAKKEEVLIVARHESNDDTLVSNLGQTGDVVIGVGTDGGIQYTNATAFTTGNNALGYHPTGVQLYWYYSSTSVPTPQVSIREDSSGVPSETVLSPLNTSSAITPNLRLVMFTTPDEVTLQPDTTYWLHVGATGGLAVFEQTESDNEDTDSQGDWSIHNTAVDRADVEPWTTATGSRVLLMSILGHGISPDPSEETPQQNMESVSEPADGDLANDDTTIGRLALNDGVTGRHSARDVDWFSFAAEANTDYQFTANQGRRNLPYYTLRIFDDAGAELQSSQINPSGNSAGTDYYNAPERRNNIAFRTHTAGTYYISIEQRNYHRHAAYTLVMFGDDYSNDMNTMATVTVDASGRNFEDFQNYLMRTDVSPESQTTDDVDWIRVALEAGATYEIVYDVKCLHRSIIEGIYDPDGNRVFDTLERKEVHARSGITVNLCSNLVTKFTPESDGDHYIAVSAKAPTVVVPDGSSIKSINYPFQGVQGTLSIKMTTPPSTAATGNPLVRGERKVGATLTGDTKGIADPSGLTNPVFNHQWQRMENGTPSDIPGAVSETYTLTDDDVGKRVQLQVRFDDDEGDAEMRTGPATSVITKAPHLLVGNISQRVIGVSPGAIRVQSTGFVTGAHGFGYTMDNATAYRGKGTPVNHGEAEIRIHGSTSESNIIERRPLANVLVVAASDLTRQSGIIVDYSARSRAKLDPGTVYHFLMAALDDVEAHGCKTARDEGLDSNSLPGFSINDRSYISLPGALSTIITHAGNACGLAIKGSELQSSNFVQDVEFTSSPTQEPMYMTGETIEATVTLNRAVTFDGPLPVLLLQIGDNQREMTYVASASTRTSWVFRYTVVADDRDDDGMSFNHYALHGYADADLSNNRVINDGMHRVNAVSQIVSNRVSSKPIAPPWYGPDEQIQFTMEFSLPVTVVGDPELEFNVTTPEGSEFAAYLSGSGTTELVFSYTVLAVDDDADGIWLNADSLRLDSDDSITGIVNGLDANLDHTALNKLENHRIDQNPRAVSQEVTSDPVGGTSSDTYGAGDAITFEVAFNQLVNVNGAPRLRFSITGPGDEYAAYVSGSGTNTLVFSYTVLATEMDPDGIYLYKNPLDYPDAATDSIVGTGNSLPAVNNGIGKEETLPGHKVDGSITN